MMAQGGRWLARASVKFVLALLLAWLVAAVAPSRALAHASLVRSKPGANGLVAEAPQEVRLWFNEPISAQFSSAQLLDLNGQPIELLGIRVDPAEGRLMVVTLPELPDGLYSVRWKVLSEADGHFTQGLLVFGVGEETDMGAAAVNQAEPPVPWPEVLLRWFNFGLLAALVGALAVVHLVLAPTERRAEVAQSVRLARRRILHWARWCAGLTMVAGLGLLAWQVVTLLESLPAGVSILSVVWQVLGRTRWGTLWLVREAILLALLGLLISRFGKRGSLALPLILGLMLAQALTGHAAALAPDTALAVVADGLHLLAASLWVGGLLALIVGLLPLLRRDSADFNDLTRAGWGPFGRLAALSVGVLVATGLYSMGRQVASPDALISTLYGQALLGKVGLMLALGAFGGLNSLLLHPRLAAPLARLLRRPSGWTPLSLRRLPALVLAEAGLGLLVVLAAGLITASPPANGPEFAPAAAAAPAFMSQPVDDLIVSLNARPNRPGQNVFNVRAVSTRRPPPADVMRVIVRFTFLDQELGQTSADATEIEPGLYQLGGGYLNLAGSWQIEVAVRRRGLEDSVAQFHWTVPAASAARPAVISDRPWESTLTAAGGVLLLVLLSGAVGVWWIQRSGYAVRRIRLPLKRIGEGRFGKQRIPQ